MRRFSQRTSLVTLNDINITPLLDLAFVLLIIFVIMSPSIQSKQENGMDLKLPQGGGPERKIDVRDLRLVEVSPQGEYMLERQRMGSGAAGADKVVRELIAAKRLNPKLVVKIRTDQNGLNKHLYAIVDGCLRNNIVEFSWATEPMPAK
jgi:biopolymer transport protein ExbD